ncbi:hypothetical protein [uncultured Serinicoccus sp.]|uniref:hypothetical protein n=1 Tax=uncultured Serinicoccus sp. TaxID=735514 RepID=UPI002615FD05|nr:hypothetical protein [uncultured Serinicoccus sp.]
MQKNVSALQLARIPVLLMVLWATGWPVRATADALAEVSMADYWGLWALTVLLSLAFVVLALLGRLSPHPWFVLAVEGLAAGVIAVVPPVSWVLWLGVGGSWVTAMSGGLAQTLAVTWLVVVGFRAVRQTRNLPRRHTPLPARPRQMGALHDPSGESRRMSERTS